MTAWMDAQGYAALTWLCTTYMMSLHVLVYLGGIGGLVWAVRRSGPAARASVWAAGALGLLVVLPLGFRADGWWTASILPGVPADLLLRFTSLEISAERLDGAAAGLGASTLRWVVWLQLFWLAGVGVVLARLGRDWMHAVWLTREAEPLGDPRWHSLLGEAREALGVTRAVRLRASREVSTPLTWGWLRPVILLPHESAGWTDGERRAVLLHEMAHVRRLDTPLFALALLGAAWFWFHPSVWWALSEWRTAREEACDRAVLRGGVRASGYATLLLGLARPARADAGIRTVAVSAGIARSTHLYRRIDAVLEAAPRPAEGMDRLPRALVAAALIAWMVGLGTLRAWPTEAVLDQAALAGGWRGEVAARLQGTDQLLNHARDDAPPAPTPDSRLTSR